MRHFFILNIILLLSCNKQNKENIYLYFDSNSSETYKFIDEGKEYEIKKFQKNNESDSKLIFKIVDENFRFIKSNNEERIIWEKEFKKINFVSIGFLYNKWKESGLFSKQNVFERIFLVEKSKEKGKYFVYEVKWIESIN